MSRMPWTPDYRASDLPWYYCIFKIIGSLKTTKQNKCLIRALLAEVITMVKLIQKLQLHETIIVR